MQKFNNKIIKDNSNNNNNKHNNRANKLIFNPLLDSPNKYFLVPVINIIANNRIFIQAKDYEILV